MDQTNDSGCSYKYSSREILTAGSRYPDEEPSPIHRHVASTRAAAATAGGDPRRLLDPCMLQQTPLDVLYLQQSRALCFATSATHQASTSFLHTNDIQARRTPSILYVDGIGNYVTGVSRRVLPRGSSIEGVG